MPVMNEHAYQDDFRRALSSYAPKISIPTVTIELPPTESTVDHIQFQNHMEAPVAEAIAQNVTRTTDIYTDPYQQGVPVRPSTTN